MTPVESKKLIEAAGGNAEFAKLLGMHASPGAKQRINNWRHRGIPASVVLENLEVIQQLAERAKPS